MPIVQNKVLSSRNVLPDEKKYPTLTNDHFLDTLVHYVNDELNGQGDKIVLEEIENPDFPSKHLRSRRKLSELLPVSSQIAQSLMKNGLKPGDYVQISMYNNCDFFLCVIGTWMAGGVACLADPGRFPDVLVEQMELTQTKFIFCSPYNVELNKTATEQLDFSTKLIVVNGPGVGDIPNLDEFITGSPTQIPDVYKLRKPEDPCVIVWSSGTIGKPKGVQNSVKSLNGIFRHHLFAPEEHEAGTRLHLSSQCMFHATGLFFISNITKYRSCLTFFSLADPFSAETVIKAVDLYQPSAMFMGSHHFSRLATLDHGSNGTALVQKLIPVGSLILLPLIPRLQKIFPNATVINAYGCTEIGGVTKGNSFANMGELLPNVKAKVVDLETRTPLGPNEPGELMVKTRTMFSGYLNFSSEENQALFDQDGFAGTGDLVMYDEFGDLHYMDRIKALIKYNIHRVCPGDVEEVIQELPEVMEVGVFGIPEPECFELVAAAVVAKPGFTISKQAIVDYVAMRMEDFNRLRGGVFFVDALPRNLQGKFVRREMLELCGLAKT